MLDVVSEVDHPVARVDVHEPGAKLAQPLRWHAFVVEDDHEVAGMHEMSRSTVDADHSGARRGRNGICRQALTVRYVEDMDLLPLYDARGLHQRFVDADRADVVQI